MGGGWQIRQEGVGHDVCAKARTDEGLSLLPPTSVPGGAPKRNSAHFPGKSAKTKGPAPTGEADGSTKELTVRVPCNEGVSPAFPSFARQAIVAGKGAWANRGREKSPSRRSFHHDGHHVLHLLDVARIVRGVRGARSFAIVSSG